MYIPTDADIVLEDTIETTGMGGIYPKGILIGKISQIMDSKNITDRYAIVETAVDFSKLETVLVIKWGTYPSKGAKPKGRVCPSNLVN